MSLSLLTPPGSQGGAPLFHVFNSWLVLSTSNSVNETYEEYLNVLRKLHEDGKISDHDVRKYVRNIVHKQKEQVQNATKARSLTSAGDNNNNNNTTTTTTCTSTAAKDLIMNDDNPQILNQYSWYLKGFVLKQDLLSAVTTTKEALFLARQQEQQHVSSSKKTKKHLNKTLKTKTIMLSGRKNKDMAVFLILDFRAKSTSMNSEIETLIDILDHYEAGLQKVVKPKLCVFLYSLRFHSAKSCIEFQTSLMSKDANEFFPNRPIPGGLSLEICTLATSHEVAISLRKMLKKSILDQIHAKETAIIKIQKWLASKTHSSDSSCTCYSSSSTTPSLISSKDDIFLSLGINITKEEQIEQKRLKKQRRKTRQRNRIESAIKIQTFIRAVLVRKIYLKLRNYIVQIQRFLKKSMIRKQRFRLQLESKIGLKQKLQTCSIEYATKKLIEFEIATSHTVSLQRLGVDIAVQHIRRICFSVVPMAVVNVFGSRCTCLDLPWSDIDLVLSPFSSDPFGSGEIFMILQALQAQQPCIQKSKLIETPTMQVIKFLWVSQTISFSVDLSIWRPSHNGLRCVDLVNNLRLFTPGLRPVVLYIKGILHDANLDTSYSGGLSSYAVTLLVQCVLQYPCPITNSFVDPNASLGEVLMQFLDVYSEPLFFEKYGVDALRQGFFPLIDLEEKIPELQPPAVVLDPLHPGNNLCLGSFSIRKVQTLFRETKFRLLNIQALSSS